MTLPARSVAVVLDTVRKEGSGPPVDTTFGHGAMPQGHGAMPPGHGELPPGHLPVPGSSGALPPGHSPVPPAARNPAALWIDYLQSELNLVLVDHEPPPF